MKRLTLVLLTLTGCTGVVPQERPWAFVASVGGIAVESPVRTAKGLILPIRADVSGLQTISVKPTTLNSIMACSRTRAEIEGNDIYVTIATSLLREGGSSRCPDAKLGALAAGENNVFYGSDRTDAVRLGEVRVAL